MERCNPALFQRYEGNIIVFLFFVHKYFNTIQYIIYKYNNTTMSSYLAVHIEYKKDNKWNLLTTLGPHFPSKSSRYVNGVWEDVEDKPDVVVNGVGYDYHNCEYFCGNIRDFFLGYLTDSPITDRGLPKDLSEGLTEYIDEESQKIGSSRGRWYSNASYFNLSELDVVYNKMLEDFKREYSDIILKQERKSHDSGIKDKLDQIMSKLGIPDTSQPQEDTEDNESSHEEWMLEDFWVAMRVYGLYEHVSDNATHYLGIYNDEDIRVVCYIC